MGMGSANERRRHYATPPLIRRVHTQNDPWKWHKITTGRCIMYKMCYVFCVKWYMWYCKHNGVRLMLTDGLVPIWHHDICNHPYLIGFYQDSPNVISTSKKRSRNVPLRLYLGWQQTSFRVTFSERSENVTRFFHNKWTGEEFTPDCRYAIILSSQSKISQILFEG